MTALEQRRVEAGEGRRELVAHVLAVATGLAHALVLPDAQHGAHAPGAAPRASVAATTSSVHAVVRAALGVADEHPVDAEARSIGQADLAGVRAARRAR